MNILNRTWNLIMGKTERKLEDLEWNNPEVVYDNALAKKRQCFEELLDAVAQFETSVSASREKMAKLNLDREQLENALRGARATESMKDGPAIVKLLEKKEEEISEHRALLEQDEKDLQGIKAELEQAHAEVERFEAESDRELAKIKALKTKEQVEQALAGIGKEPELQSLARLRDRQKKEENRLKLFRELNESKTLNTERTEDEYVEKFRNLCREQSSVGEIFVKEEKAVLLA
jgi:phage shock protein A